MSSNKLGFVVLIAVLSSSCSSYRPFEESARHGYQSQDSEQGKRVSFTTWRAWSDDKLCAQAKRRAQEVAPDAPLLGPELEQLEDGFSHVDSVNVISTRESGLRSPEMVSVMVTPDFVMGKQVRSCTWIIPAPA